MNHNLSHSQYIYNRILDMTLIINLTSLITAILVIALIAIASKRTLEFLKSKDEKDSSSLNSVLYPTLIGVVLVIAFYGICQIALPLIMEMLLFLILIPIELISLLLYIIIISLILYVIYKDFVILFSGDIKNILNEFTFSKYKERHCTCKKFCEFYNKHIKKHVDCMLKYCNFNKDKCFLSSSEKKDDIKETEDHKIEKNKDNK